MGRVVLHRQALLQAVLPAPDGWPGWDTDRARSFWTRFGAAAPSHLRLGMSVATLVLAVLLPLATRQRTLRGLDAESRDAVLQRAARLPGLSELVDVVRIVACLAYFDDDRVQAHVRASP